MKNKFFIATIITGVFCGTTTASNFSTDFYPARSRKDNTKEKRVFHDISNTRLCKILKKGNQGDVSFKQKNETLTKYYSTEQLIIILSQNKSVNSENCNQIIRNIGAIINSSKIQLSTKELPKEVKK